MKNLISAISLFLFLNANYVNGQAVWPWDFGSSASTFSTNNSGSTTFLPPCPAASGPATNFVYISNSSGSAISLANPGLSNLGSNTEIQANATSSGWVKWGVDAYTNNNAKSFYTKFTVVFAGNSTNTATSPSGQWIFAQGKAAFTGSASSTALSFNNVLSALRFQFGSSGSITTSYYTGSTSSWTTITGAGISQQNTYTIEIFGNSFNSGTQYYTRNNTTYTVTNNTWDLWINNTLIIRNLPSAGVGNGQSMGAWEFYGTGASGSDNAYMFVDNVEFLNTYPNAYSIFYSKSTGALNNLATWGSNTDGSGYSPNYFTDNGQTFYIRNNPNPTITANWTVSGTGTTLNLGDGSNPINFTIPSAYSYSGVPININNNATLTIQNTILPPLGTLATGSTIVYDYAGAQNVTGGINYYNLKTQNTGTKTVTGNLAVDGTLTVTSTSTLDLSTYTLSGTLSTISNSGIIKTSSTSATPLPTGRTWGGTIDYGATGGSQTIVSGTYNNLIIDATSSSNTLGGAITVNGAYSSATGGTLNSVYDITFNGTTTCGQSMNATAGTVTYGFATGGQNVLSGSYNNLQTNNTSGTNTACGNITLSSALSTTAGGTLNMLTYTLLGGFTATANSGTVKTYHTATTTPLATGKTWGGTVEYAVTGGGQTVLNGTYNNLTVDNTTGTNSAGGEITVNATLNTTTGGILDMGTNRLIEGSSITISNNGTIRTSVATSSSMLPIPTGKTWGGTVEFAGGSSQTVVPGTYNNLTMSGAGGGIASGNITVNGILNLSAANPSAMYGVLEMVSNYNSYPGISATSFQIVSYILTMGANATTTGQGDVTGKIYRSTVNANTPYSFGNQFTTYSYTVAPTDVTVIVTIGTAYGVTSSWGDPHSVQRSYEMIPTGGTGGRVTMNLHYLDSELNGNTEADLVTGDYDIGGGAPLGDEHGRSSYDFTNNYIGLSGIPIDYFIYNASTHDWRTVFTLHEYYSGHTVWDGSSSSSWSEPDNWSAGVPGLSKVAVIPDATTTPNDPILVAGQTFGGIQIQAGGYLNLNGQIVTIDAYNYNGWEDQSGTSNYSGSEVIIANTTLSTPILGIPHFNNLTINTGAGVTIEPNSHIYISGTLSNSGSFDASTFTNTFEYNGAAQTIITPGNNTYSSLTLSGSGTKTMPSSALHILGDFTLAGTASTSAAAALTIDGDFTLGSGTSFNAGSYTHNLAGDFINSGGTFTGSTSTINLNGTGAQSIGESSSTTFYNLTNSNTNAIVTATRDISCTGDFSNSGFMDMTTNVLSVSGTVTNTGTIKTSYTGISSPLPAGKSWGGTVEYGLASGSQTIVEGNYNNLVVDNTTGTNTVGGAIIINGAFSAATGGTISTAYNMTFNGTTTCGQSISASSGTVRYGEPNGGQYVLNGSYYSLKTDNTAGTNTACGDITLSNTLTTSSGGMLNMLTYTLLGAFNASGNNGIIKTYHTATTTPLAPGKMWGGTVEYAATSGGQTIVSGTYNNLTLDNSNGTNTVGGNITVNTGSLTTSAGGTMDMGSSYILSGSGTFINSNGTIKTSVLSSTSTSPIPSGKNWGGVVEFASSGGSQTVVAGTYTTLNLSNTSGTQSASGNINASNLNNTGSSTSTLDMGSNTLTVTTPNNTGIIKTQSTSMTPLSVGKTWGGTIEYNASAGQTLVNGTYYNVILSGSGNKTIESGGTPSVNGTLSLRGTAALVPGTGSLSYGSLATLEYAGASLQTTTSSEFPATNGPANLDINNSNGVNYNLDRRLSGNLTVGSGSVFNINEGSALFVDGITTNNSNTNNLLIKSSSSGSGCLCIQNSGVNAKVQRYVTGRTSSPYPYHYISTPLSNAPYSQIAGDYNIYWYNEDVLNGDLDQGWTRYLPSDGDMVSGRGYASVGNYTNKTLEFSGILNFPPLLTNVTYRPTPSGSYPWKNGLDPQGWNLVGNPFSCALSVYDFLADNYANLDNLAYAVYSWDDYNGTMNRSGDYNTHNGTTGVAATDDPTSVPNGKIAVGQGFFVKVNSSATEISFNAGQRTANTDPQFFMPDPATISTFRFSLNGKDRLYNQSVITFLPEATNSYDFYYDAMKLKGNPDIALYSIINGKDYAIQGLPPVTSDSKPVPIGFDISETGSYTFEAEQIDNFPGNVVIILEDKLLHSFTDLINTREYHFSANAGQIRDRFVLHFSLNPNTIEELKKTEKIFNVYTTGKTIHINTLKPQPGKSVVSVYNMYGQEIVSMQFDNLADREITFEGSKGYYLVSIKNEQNYFTEKVLIK